KPTSDVAVKNYVESFFEPIRYSREVVEAKQAIIESLNPVYASMKQENKNDAFKNLVAKYPDLESLLEAAGIDRAKADEWRGRKTLETFDDFRARFNKHRKRIWITVALLTISIFYIPTAVLYSSTYMLPIIVINAVLLALGVFFAVRFRNRTSAVSGCSVDGFEKTEKLFDRYARKSINWLMILFLEFFVAAFDIVSLSLNSKPYEIAEHLAGDLRIVAFVVFFFIKNLLIMRWLIKNIDYENQPKFGREFRRTLVLSAVYWAAAAGLYFAFEYLLAKDISVVFFVVYVLVILAFNVLRLKKFCYLKQRFVKPVVAAILVFALVAGGYTLMSRNVWLTQPYINSVANLSESNNKIEYDPESGIYTITNDDDSDFRILQLTDIHLGGSLLSYDKDLKALKACYKLIEYTKPDFVVVTGDLCFPMGIMSFSFNNSAPVQQFAAFMRNVGIPWAFTYGNHDTETMSITDQTGLNELYQSLSWDTSKNLLYPYTQPDVWGRSNQLIEVRNSDGTLNQALFLIDSNAYTGEGLNKFDFIHDDQVDWYKDNVLRLSAEEGKSVSSLAFFHIPLQQYRTAYELYEAGSDEVKYFFGANNETMINKVCCSDYPSEFFDVAKELGSTKAMFCGHDHYNNISLEYQGIRLTYGMSIDYLVMPGIARDTAQRGGTLITCHTDGSYEIEQIPLASIE
ncbi:MAG: metallophosphoesterase, partial [Clostridia bacterium]|nr:metallophosphoesterase [Clostridia bacterium]